jgi:hypothetical protein
VVCRAVRVRHRVGVRFHPRQGQGKTRANYLRRVVAERLTGKPCETFSGAHMQRGQAQEPDARMRYEVASGNIVEEVGFMRHAEIAAGCSPDGLIDDDGGVEIKCVIPAVQVETILVGGYPSEHKRPGAGESLDHRPHLVGLRELLPRHAHEGDAALHPPRFQGRAVHRMLETEVRRFLADVEIALDVLLGRDRTEELLRACAKVASLAKVAA